jgi:hypothetical protein
MGMTTTNLKLKKTPSTPAPRRKISLAAARARFELMQRLDCLNGLEKTFMEDFIEMDRNLWEELWPTFASRRPCSLKTFAKTWERLLDLETALQVVARMRQQLLSHRQPPPDHIAD